MSIAQAPRLLVWDVWFNTPSLKSPNSGVDPDPLIPAMLPTNEETALMSALVVYFMSFLLPPNSPPTSRILRFLAQFPAY